MKTVSLKIDDSIFGETEKILSRISIPRNRYINEAIEYYKTQESKNGRLYMPCGTGFIRNPQKRK